jgi:hypothetical protein
MADIKEVDFTKATSINDSDYIRVVTVGGQSLLIKKSDLLPIISDTVSTGIVDRTRTILYDFYRTSGKVYRALTFTTNITPGDFMAVYLDIKDILSWNYSGNLKLTVKVILINYIMARMHLVNDTTEGLIDSIYAYVNSNDKLCFTINFKAASLNISNGVTIANCLAIQNNVSPDFRNRIVSHDETDKYTSGTSSNQIGIIL